MLAGMTIGRAALIGLVLADGVGLGALAVFTCWPPLFLSLDFPKLVLLSASLTMPVVALGALVYQTGAASRDFSRLHESLVQNIPYVLLTHLLYVMGGLVSIGAQSLFPIGSPYVPYRIFWTFSTLCVAQLLFQGLYLEHQRPWMRRVVPYGLGAFAVVRLCMEVGKTLHWWS